MNIFNNIAPGPESVSGSSAQRAATAAVTVKAVAAEESARSGAGEETPKGLQVFQLLLSSTDTATPEGDTALPLAETSETAATPAADGSTAAGLNLFMSLLPGLPPATATPPAPTPAGLAAVEASAATAANPALPAAGAVTTGLKGVSDPAATAADITNTPVTTPAAVASATSGLSGLLMATTLSVLKQEPSAALSESDLKTAAAEPFNRVLLALDHALQPRASQAAPVVAHQAVLSAPDALADLPMTHHEWPTALGHRLMWTMGEGIQKAELRVSPENLGPIHVHIQVKDDQTDIRFTVLHPQAREALETSIPRLREMFEQQGLNLMQAQVFSQTPQHPGERQSSGAALPQTAAVTSSTAENDTPVEKPKRQGWGLIDDYA